MLDINKTSASELATIILKKIHLVVNNLFHMAYSMEQFICLAVCILCHVNYTPVSARKNESSMSLELKRKSAQREEAIWKTRKLSRIFFIS